MVKVPVFEVWLRAKVEGSKSVGFSKLKNLTDADIVVLSMGGLETHKYSAVPIAGILGMRWITILMDTVLYQ